MSNWKGYLLKAIKTDTILDGRYILAKSWDATPNQREEIEAYRDDNTRDLYRYTADGKKSKFKFTTVPMRLNQKIEFLNFFTDAEDDYNERKVELEYWDDEESQYETAYFYRPDMHFVIKKYSDDDIWYDSLDLTFVEY